MFLKGAKVDEFRGQNNLDSGDWCDANKVLINSDHPRSNELKKWWSLKYDQSKFTVERPTKADAI
jgi:hypothetical protein